ncbi:MAG: Asp-tRNA(Asn)/Glu-tRNA(Gln) amidotransferase subunit GatC [Gammaproteobacteria bacterium]|nr:Asp-tRNA(Asn)/Glu-tRNA(Gln) amidotransferase subunit GatC [Gammaproteobacteria bacterium]
MTLDAETVKKIARLARLKIDDQAIAGYSKNLTNILQLVEQMNAVSTDQVEPMAHPLDASQRLREDRVTEVNQREQFQSVAPQVQDGLYLVPKVIE